MADIVCIHMQFGSHHYAALELAELHFGRICSQHISCKIERYIYCYVDSIYHTDVKNLHIYNLGRKMSMRVPQLLINVAYWAETIPQAA